MLERLKDFFTGLSLVMIAICFGLVVIGISLFIMGILIPLLIPVGLAIIGIFTIYLLGHCVRKIRKDFSKKN